MIEKILKAGTVVKINGIPVELAQDTVIKTTEGNYKLFFNHESPLSGNPTQAA